MKQLTCSLTYVASALSSPLDRSKRFTRFLPWQTCSFRYQLGFSWKHSSNTAIAQRLFSQLFSYNYSVMNYNAVNSRIVTICIKSRPANMSIVQIYAQTQDKDDEIHDDIYEQLQVTIASIKRSDYLIVMDDFNAILGNEKMPCVIAAHGTGIRNNSGQRLLEFCSVNYLFVTNIGFRHDLRRNTTWISPDGRTKNDIDYIMIRSRFK